MKHKLLILTATIALIALVCLVACDKVEKAPAAEEPSINEEDLIVDYINEEIKDSGEILIGHTARKVAINDELTSQSGGIYIVEVVTTDWDSIYVSRILATISGDGEIGYAVIDVRETIER